MYKSKIAPCVPMHITTKNNKDGAKAMITIFSNLCNAIETLSEILIPLFIIKSTPIPSIVFYALATPTLIPLHELGHYYAVKFFLRKKNLKNITCCMSLRKTYCSTWQYFSRHEINIIALAGIFTTVTYYSIMFIAIAIKYNKFAFLLLLLACIEVVFNLIPMGHNDVQIILNNAEPDTIENFNKHIDCTFFYKYICSTLLFIITISVLV